MVNVSYTPILAIWGVATTAGIFTFTSNWPLFQDTFYKKLPIMGKLWIKEVDPQDLPQIESIGVNSPNCLCSPSLENIKAGSCLLSSRSSPKKLTNFLDWSRILTIAMSDSLSSFRTRSPQISWPNVSRGRLRVNVFFLTRTSVTGYSWSISWTTESYARYSSVCASYFNRSFNNAFLYRFTSTGDGTETCGYGSPDLMLSLSITWAQVNPNSEFSYFWSLGLLLFSGILGYRYPASVPDSFKELLQATGIEIGMYSESGSTVRNGARNLDVDAAVIWFFCATKCMLSMLDEK
ncbi:hypothetical protein OGAPHI_006136 [Ogataea philodendri]|uniref:Uncharacterized protein n=1 Tax=Ogataea philodendri TaxID=1378263 RepID=A0A9P8NYR4_9ASCO|nr:uncharacterized protein OGAPHI_006136 [Ogataea philodendri]KAH3661957.1 hypothetical protein OGAPHI_006136 [Ogataea philodendri]